MRASELFFFRQQLQDESGRRQKSLEDCSPWDRKESDMTEHAR